MQQQNIQIVISDKIALQLIHIAHRTYWHTYGNWQQLWFSTKAAQSYAAQHNQCGQVGLKYVSFLRQKHNWDNNTSDHKDVHHNKNKLI